MIPRDSRDLALMMNRLCYEHPGMQDLLIQKLAEILKFSSGDDEIEQMLVILQYRADAANRRARDNLVWEARKP